MEGGTAAPSVCWLCVGCAGDSPSTLAWPGSLPLRSRTFAELLHFSHTSASITVIIYQLPTSVKACGYVLNLSKT